MKKKKLRIDTMYTKKIFTSKSNVLGFLQNKLKKSEIEKIYYFTINEWNENENEILDHISKEFGKKKVVVRSSAIGEDSIKNSFAGIYESILNVKPTCRKKLKKAIIDVVSSYKKAGSNNIRNQILIQQQATNIITSGVIFSRSADIGAPYYLINYEEGQSTVGVTKGLVNNTIKIFRKINLNKNSSRWNMLLQAVQEIELILNTSLLDIEFGITKDYKVVVFQVRPITSVKKIEIKNLDYKIKRSISNATKILEKLNKSQKITGKITAFSDMSDWNPSEIIGNNPNLLDYSLYRYLIMKNSWVRGRAKLGYQNFCFHELMVKFGNKPYVDLRASFNSLTPSTLNKKIKEKLINYYINQVLKYPHLHDKVEFEILFTCNELSLDTRLKKLKNYGFSNEEIKRIKSALIDLTNNVLGNFEKILIDSANSIVKMSQNRVVLMKKKSDKGYYHQLKTAEGLLKDCKKFGIIPFVTMARIAFIGTTILKSLEKKKYLDSKLIENFMNSISTPLSDFQLDLTKYQENRISKQQFLNKYGHLRPGTYDITASRYDKKNPFFGKIVFTEQKHKKITINNKRISKILKSNGLDFNELNLFTFVEKALVNREILKFEFTHNLSDALELIELAGKQLGFTKEEISNLDINTVLISYKKFSKNKLKMFWKKKIELQKKKKIVNNYMILPPIVSSKEDFQIIRYFTAEPNYITSKSISSEIVNLHNLKEIPELGNKLVLLENADPGYDWLFTRNILGLITKYGGAASHMSIRCAEIGLPAAIGCGEILFEQLILSSRVLLDCKNKQIVILEHERENEDIQVRKTLKSLGYIK